MKVLAFTQVRAATHTEFNKEVYRAAIFELNNLLTIPMKILEIKTSKYLDDQDTEVIGYAVHVEDCADEAEWDRLVSSYVIGFNTKARTMRSIVKEKNYGFTIRSF